MRNTIKTLLTVSLAFGTVAQGADTLTLNEAVFLALENNRVLRSSALNVAKAEDRLAATRTRQLPNFNVYALGAQQLRSFDYTLQRGVLGDYGGGPLPSEDTRLTTSRVPTGVLTARVAQPITQLIQIRRSMDVLKTGIDIAKEETREEQQKLVRDVKRVYYSLQQVESNLRTVRETMALYQEIEKLTNNYVVQQVALRGDLLDAQTRLAKAVQLQVSLNNQRSAAKEQLNQLLGRDVLTEFEVAAVLDATSEEFDLAVARERALQNRPELRQAALRHLQAEQDVRAKKAELIPEVSAEFNNLSFMNWGRFMPTQSTSIGVSVTWEPFDWGRRKHELAEKQRTVSQAELAQREAESGILLDVNDKFRQLQYRRAELAVARLAQSTAIENVRVIKNKYAAQAVLVKDVLQSQVSLEQSNSDYQQALTSFWNAQADFERALGEDQ